MPEDLTDPNEDTAADEKILDEALGGKEGEEKEEKPVEEEGEETTEEEEKPTVEEGEEEEEELTTPRPAFKEITAKFPSLFKEFPALRHTFFREQEFSKIFPSVEEAQATFERAQNFDTLEQSVMEGNPALLLDSIRETDSEALGKFVADFLPTLFKNPLTKQLYYDATIPVIENVLRSALVEGKKRGNTNLEYAAQYINEFLFGTTEINPPKDSKPDPEREKFEQEKMEHQRTRYIEFHESADSSAIEDTKTIIGKGLEASLSPFLRGKIIDEVFSRVDKQIAADPQHMRLMNSLWEKAVRAGMTKEFHSRLRNAYLERAKPLIPAMRNKVLKEALETKESREEGKYTPHKELVGGPAKPQNLAGLKAKDIDWTKTSDADVIDAALGGKSKVVLRKR